MGSQYKFGLTLILSLLYSVLSIVTVNSIAYINGYQIGDISGLLYEKVWSPLFGLCSVWIFYFLLRRKFRIDYKYTLTALLIGPLFIIFIVHFVAFGSGFIGGWYKIPETIQWSEKINNEVISLSNSNNDEIAAQAWEEFLRRGQEDTEILMNYLDDFSRSYPVNYFDSTRTHDVMKILAEKKDKRIIKYLEEMLGSVKYVEVTEPDGTTRRIYHSRVIAEKLLKSINN